MLIIDGVKYELWTPLDEDELERTVNEHAQEIFGDNSIYFDRKQRLESASGIISIPDGYAIVLSDTPNWHIVEVELSSHPPYEHIVPQTDKFINAVEDNPYTRNRIVEALYDALDADELLKVKIRRAVGRDKDIHKFLADLVVRPPTITVIIEKETEQVKEALRKYSQKRVIQFQTFRRVAADSIHAHLFEPAYERGIEPSGSSQLPIRDQEDRVHESGNGRITIKDLVDDSRIRIGQAIYDKSKKHKAIITQDGKIRLLHNGSEYNTPSRAAQTILGHAVNGWIWWYTARENGTECLLKEIRSEYNAHC